MAQNYAQFSEALRVPEEKRQAVIEFLMKWETAVEDPKNDFYGGLSYEFPSTDDCGELAIWFYADEVFSEEELDAFVHGVLDVLESKEPVFVNVAYWCSKPHLGEFGGGCYIFYPNPDKDYYVSAFGAARDYVKSHSADEVEA